MQYAVGSRQLKMFLATSPFIFKVIPNQKLEPRTLTECCLLPTAQTFDEKVGPIIVSFLIFPATKPAAVPCIRVASRHSNEWPVAVAALDEFAGEAGGSRNDPKQLFIAR